MVPLARDAGVARGTLYLYFPTREELLLALYREETEAWLGQLEPLVPGRMDTRDFLRVVYTSATARPIFLSLAAQVTSVIEKNVSAASLAESKKELARVVEAAGRCTARALGRSVEDATEVAVGLFTLLLGVTVAFGEPSSPGFQVPVLPEEPMAAFLRFGQLLVDGSTASRA
jgi:AcrR family transcriptional regulator